ncbi:MAG: hypothetical protein ACXV8O_01460 [Methylobacter sp.]
MTVEEYVYSGRNNTIELALSSDGVDITHTGITRCQVKIGTTVIDSSTSPELFDLTHTDRLILELGSSGLSEGDYTAKLYVYDINNTDGIFWGDFSLTVSE